MCMEQARLSAGAQARSRLLPSTPRLRAERCTRQDDALRKRRRDLSSRVRLLLGSSTGAARPVVGGTQRCRCSGLPLPPARSTGSRDLGGCALFGSAQGKRLWPIAAISPRRRWTGLQTATDTASEQRFRIVHPFHPLRSRVPVCVGSRQRAGEERQFVIRRPDGSLCLVPASWTDCLPPDPYLMIGKGRSHFRVEDLIALADMLRGIES